MERSNNAGSGVVGVSMSGLVERALWLASGQDDPHSQTIIELTSRILELESDTDKDPWFQACMEAREGCNQRSRTIASLRRHLTSAKTRILELEAALRPFANYLGDTGDLDSKGQPLPDNQGPGWVYLTMADFRRARSALPVVAPTTAGQP